MKLFCEKRLVKSVKLFPLNIKLINPIQKYPHITESYACILKMFVTIVNLLVDLLISFFISFGICSTPKLSKYVTVLVFTYNAIQWVSMSECSSRLITYAPYFIVLCKLSLE